MMSFTALPTRAQTLHLTVQIRHFFIMNKKTKLKLEHCDLAKSAKEKLDLWRRMQQGDTKALMKLSFLRKMITEEEYEGYQRIENEYREG
jgi:hypothetical protein